MELLHTGIVKYFIVYLPFNESGASSLTCPWACVEISQIRIVTESADEMESRFSNTIHECRCGEIGISNHNISHFGDFFAVTPDDYDVMQYKSIVTLDES